jgi:phosphoribosyl-ATP pyrophosphohydrolase
MSSAAPLEKLERTIASRAARPNEKSYTSKLLAGGLELMGAKIKEEAAEVVEAAGESGEAGHAHFIREVGDLVYHLLVLMQDRKCTLGDVGAELSRRFGVSGIDEKAARKPAAADEETDEEEVPKTRAPRKKAKAKPATKSTTKAKKKSKR